MGCQFLYKGELEPVPKTSAEVAAASKQPFRAYITVLPTSLNAAPTSSVLRAANAAASNNKCCTINNFNHHHSTT
jgi:phage-related baseplate assembly protein